MKIEKIKPIPKYIQKKIKLYDDQLKTAPFGRTRFYAYFTKNDGELVKVMQPFEIIKNNGIVSPLSFTAFIPTDASAKILSLLLSPVILSVGTNKDFPNIPTGMKATTGAGHLTIRLIPTPRQSTVIISYNTFPNTNTAPLTDIRVYKFSNTCGFTNNIRKQNI